MLSACKDDKKNNSENSTFSPIVEEVESDSIKTISLEVEKQIKEKKETDLPSELRAVFNTHGGLTQWKNIKNLCFEMKGENGDETHTVSLPDGKIKVESKDWSIGYDGKKIWLLRHDVGYKGDPVLYHNLMFNFFAMPFGISNPTTTPIALEPTELDGKVYNGYKVSYDNGMGSSKGEYKLYFDPETNQMTWLAYTVNLKGQKESAKWHYIKYSKWHTINGLLLPEKLSWYKVEDGKPKSKEMDVKFDNVSATKTILDASVFKKPAEGRFVN